MWVRFPSGRFDSHELADFLLVAVPSLRREKYLRTSGDRFRRLPLRHLSCDPRFHLLLAFDSVASLFNCQGFANSTSRSVMTRLVNTSNSLRSFSDGNSSIAVIMGGTTQPPSRATIGYENVALFPITCPQASMPIVICGHVGRSRGGTTMQSSAVPPPTCYLT